MNVDAERAAGKVIHGDGCPCENCVHPHQMYCPSCKGPLRHEGGGFFVSHKLRDCVDWLARADQFTEPVVMPGCRPAWDLGEQ